MKCSMYSLGPESREINLREFDRFQWKEDGQIFRKCVVSAPVLFVFFKKTV